MYILYHNDRLIDIAPADTRWANFKVTSTHKVQHQSLSPSPALLHFAQTPLRHKE